jgi:hypothetical protein
VLFEAPPSIGHNLRRAADGRRAFHHPVPAHTPGSKRQEFDMSEPLHWNAKTIATQALPSTHAKTAGVRAIPVLELGRAQPTPSIPASEVPVTPGPFPRGERVTDSHQPAVRPGR